MVGVTPKLGLGGFDFSVSEKARQAAALTFDALKKKSAQIKKSGVAIAKKIAGAGSNLFKKKTGGGIMVGGVQIVMNRNMKDITNRPRNKIQNKPIGKKIKNKRRTLNSKQLEELVTSDIEEDSSINELYEPMVEVISKYWNNTDTYPFAQEILGDLLYKPGLLKNTLEEFGEFSPWLYPHIPESMGPTHVDFIMGHHDPPMIDDEIDDEIKAQTKKRKKSRKRRRQNTRKKRKSRR